MATALSGVEEKRGGEVEPNNTKELILPTGYTFAPYDDELILGYLVNKIMGFDLPANIIKDMIDFYERDPHQLPSSDFKHGENRDEAYYFTQTQTEHTEKIKRSSKGGYWEACHEEEIYDVDGEIVGFKTMFVFYSTTKEGDEIETSWVMHEFKVNPSIIPTQALEVDDTIKTKIQSYKICRIVNEEDSGDEEEPADDLNIDNLSSQ